MLTFNQIKRYLSAILVAVFFIVLAGQVTLAAVSPPERFSPTRLLHRFSQGQVTLAAAAQPEAKKSVLALNSYHKGYKWADDIAEGISAVLGPSARNIELQMEYMDTQRISDAGYQQRLYESYKYKFRDKKFDVIVASDDPAFNFLRKYHAELFPGTPIVFCGVNYFEDSMLAGEDLFTGVVEGQDIKATLDLALKLHPDTKDIYIINDKTVTGNAIGKTLAETMPEYRNRVNFISLIDYDMKQIQEKVANLPANSLVLFLIFFRDVSGQSFTYDESISRISAKCNVPIYGVWDFSLGNGIVGGMLTSGYYQGELAASIARRILNGEKARDIPVVKNSPNHFMFDSIQLKRFGIKNAALPQDSIILNDLRSDHKQVLVLNSYHYGMPWVQGIIDGVNGVMHNKPNIDLYYEFMDTKRNIGPEYTQKLIETYKYKFSNKRFDAVIVADNDAYNLMLKYHQELFPDVPIVFCGVNYFQIADIAGNQLITGVAESVDIKKTIDIAQSLHPKVSEIVVINDKTSTGIANKRAIEPIIADFPQIKFTFYEDMNLSEIQERVAVLPDNSLILLMTFNKDKSNNVYSYEEALAIIAQKARVPIYSLWDFYIGQGIVGGMLTSSTSQGEAAAKMVLQILDGVRPENIPIIEESPNRYMFDYTYINRFNIDMGKLPADSQIINKPTSPYEKYLMVTLVLMLAAAAVLLFIQHKRSQDQLKIFATKDALTGVLNRRTGLKQLEELIDHAKLSNSKVTVCFTDVNDLKAVNDDFGHQAGDKLIQDVSSLLRQQLRKGDILCRFGGDEFLLVFADCDTHQAKLIWERIEIDIQCFNISQNNSYKISLSYGFTEYDTAFPVSADELIRVADAKMYECKHRYKSEKCALKSCPDSQQINLPC